MRITNSLHLCASDRQTLLRANCAGTVSDLFSALLNGAVVLPFDLWHSDISTLPKWLKSESLTIWRSAPSFFRVIFDSLPDNTSFPHLRVVFLCGESVQSTDLDLFRAHCGADSLLMNCYGTTETATVTLFLCDRNANLTPGAMPLGSPVQDMAVHLVDDSGRHFTGAGQGEIVVGSQYLARGYLNDPKLTSQVFGTDPEDPNVGLFYSGDIAQRLDDGNLVCLGRHDWRTNISGQQIEPVEIETALQNIEEIREAAVTVIQHAGGHQQLVAYIVVNHAPSPSTQILRKRLEQWLPSYMIPTRFLAVSRLPHTASGKIDRQVLPSLEA